MSSIEKTNASPSRRNILLIVIAVIILTIAAFVVFGRSERSVAAYCKVYQSEKTRLSALPGNTYPSGVFNDEISDASEFATAFGKLESAAPDEIRSDVKTLQGIYKKIADDPSQAIAASLSGSGAEQNVKKWTIEHCN